MQKNIDIRAAIHNRFDVEVIDARTGVLRQKAQAMNVVCNGLWNALFANRAYFSNIAFGSGTGVPSVSDTALFTYVGNKAVSDLTYNKGTGYRSVTRHITLMENEYVDVTLSEVGIYNNNALMTHAMLVDMSGNLITITKTNVDIINIYATVYLHVQNAYSNGSIKIESDSYFGNYLLGTDTRKTMYFCPSTLGKNVAFPQKNNGVASVTSNVSAKTLTINANRVAVSAWNDINGIPGFIFGSDTNGSLSNKVTAFLSIDAAGNAGTPIPQITSESVGTGDGTKVGFYTHFIVDKDKPVHIYINGEETEDANFDDNPINANGLLYMKHIKGVDAQENIIFDDAYMFGYNGSNTGEAPRYFYNTRYETTAITNASGWNSGWYVSNDFINWEYVQGAVPPQYQHYKYWDDRQNRYPEMASLTAQIAPNIIFDDPPPAGAIITVDYTPAVIPKDENHVYDLSVTISFGEYTPEEER